MWGNIEHDFHFKSLLNTLVAQVGNKSTRWRHQKETFSALLALCVGNSPVKGQWRGTLMSSLTCAWTNGWVNNRDAGYLRRHRAHYDVTVMLSHACWCQSTVTSLSFSVKAHQDRVSHTETEMSSFWWNFHHWLHWKLSKWQLPVQPVIKISSKWRHFRFSAYQQTRPSLVQIMACRMFGALP